MLCSGLYSGGFDIEYPVNVGDWAIVVDAFVRWLDFTYLAELLCVYHFSLSSLHLTELLMLMLS